VVEENQLNFSYLIGLVDWA